MKIETDLRDGIGHGTLRSLPTQYASVGGVAEALGLFGYRTLELTQGTAALPYKCRTLACDRKRPPENYYEAVRVSRRVQDASEDGAVSFTSLMLDTAFARRRKGPCNATRR